MSDTPRELPPDFDDADLSEFAGLEWNPFAIERELSRRGYTTIAGIDEVGMGCLAGPVHAAAVVLTIDQAPEGVFDSKALNAKTRESLAPRIRHMARGYAIAFAEVDEIDRLNIFHAAKLAMVRAIQALPCLPDLVLVDGKFPIPTEIPQRCLVRGDRLSVSIAAASILAKVVRDARMTEFEAEFPGYGFAKHKGYGTLEHRRALQSLGPSRLHRKTFSWTPV